MSQQINLLAREQNPVGSALAAMALVLVVVLGLLAYDFMLYGETAGLQREADAGQRAIAQFNANLQAVRQPADSNNDATALKAEIETLRLKADSAKQWLEQIDNGSLGSPNGYAQYLSTLGGVPESGVWLTSVSVSNAGKVVNIGGRSLHNESVLRYAMRLNEVFAAKGVQFNSVEMTPEKTAPPTVTFRLY